MSSYQLIIILASGSSILRSSHELYAALYIYKDGISSTSPTPAPPCPNTPDSSFQNRRRHQNGIRRLLHPLLREREIAIESNTLGHSRERNRRISRIQARRKDQMLEELTTRQAALTRKPAREVARFVVHYCEEGCVVGGQCLLAECVELRCGIAKDFDGGFEGGEIDGLVGGSRGYGFAQLREVGCQFWNVGCWLEGEEGVGRHVVRE